MRWHLACLISSDDVLTPRHLWETGGGEGGALEGRGKAWTLKASVVLIGVGSRFFVAVSTCICFLVHEDP
jgi:hypothetical protein